MNIVNRVLSAGDASGDLSKQPPSGEEDFHVKGKLCVLSRNAQMDGSPALGAIDEGACESTQSTNWGTSAAATSLGSRPHPTQASCGTREHTSSSQCSFAGKVSCLSQNAAACVDRARPRVCVALYARARLPSGFIAQERSCTGNAGPLSATSSSCPKQRSLHVDCNITSARRRRRRVRKGGGEREGGREGRREGTEGGDGGREGGSERREREGEREREIQANRQANRAEDGDPETATEKRERERGREARKAATLKTFT